MGQIHPQVCDNYGVSSEVYVAELNFDRLIAVATTDRRYKPLPKYPAVVRDLALLVDETVLALSLIHI